MSARKRDGFTLVELLVVIAIISILIGLIMAAVMAIRGKDSLARTKIEMLEIEQGLELFKTKYSMYPPSEITVGQDKTAIQAQDPNTTYILSRIWPNLDYSQAFGPNGMSVSGTVTLKGDQCLVLFLGGRHDVGGCYGLSTSKSNPLAAGVEHDAPFVKFQPGRLFKRNPATPFYSYADGFYRTSAAAGQTTMSYAYFTPQRTGYVETHCNTMTDLKGNYPRPYKDTSTGQYLNRQSFQLLSAGADSLWGNSRLWNSANGLGDLTVDPANRDSVDNISNFSAMALLGS